MISLDCTKTILLLLTSLQEDEVKHHKRMDSARDGESAVEARRASFAWEQQMPPALHDISLKAIKGQLVMVVGVVGSGKSSLIAALLGELHGRGGTVEVLYICKALNRKPLSSYLIPWWNVCVSANFPYRLFVYAYIFHMHVCIFPYRS